MNGKRKFGKRRLFPGAEHGSHVRFAFSRGRGGDGSLLGLAGRRVKGKVKSPGARETSDRGCALSAEVVRARGEWGLARTVLVAAGRPLGGPESGLAGGQTVLEGGCERGLG